MPGPKRSRPEADKEVDSGRRSRRKPRPGEYGAEPPRITEEQRRELEEHLRRHPPGAPMIARETALAYGAPPAPPRSRDEPDLPRPRLAGAPPSPEQHMVIGDYHRARQGFESDAELARLIGVHRSRVSGWKNGELPDRAHARLLTAVAVVVGELARFMDPAVIADWLTAPQPELDGREPIERLRQGRLADVLQAVNATEHGAYG